MTEERRAYQKAWRDKNRDRILARRRERRAARKEELNAKWREWRRANIEKNLARERARYEANPAKEVARVRRWQINNPVKNRQIATVREHRRRAREATAESTLTTAEWRDLLEFYQHRCAYCGADGKLTQEHVVPLSRGGGTTAENVVPACISCNASKGAKTLEEWLR